MQGGHLRIIMAVKPFFVFVKAKKWVRAKSKIDVDESIINDVYEALFRVC